MSDLITKALKAKRESKSVDFKTRIDLTEPHTWCELIKDIVAMANSGGGVILVGADDNGNPTGDDVTQVLEVDPATVADKIYRYTGVHFEDFEISEKVKRRKRLAAIEVSAVDTPIVFTKPGTYA